jgi:hypothetical protein
MASGFAQTPSREPPQDGTQANADERAAGAQPRDAPADGMSGLPGPPPRGDERLGPLAISRTRKADGRALLLYSRVERDASDTADAQT